MEIDYLADTPQIHLHFLTDDDFYDEYGYGKTEICCHGCSQSILLYYTKTNARKKDHITAKDEFKQNHLHCKNREYETECPPIRIGCKIVDIRPKKKETKKRVLTKPK